jgi:hypothetical protein
VFARTLPQYVIARSKQQSKLLVDQIASDFHESHHMQERRLLRPCWARNDREGRRLLRPCWARNDSEGRRLLRPGACPELVEGGLVMISGICHSMYTIREIQLGTCRKPCRDRPVGRLYAFFILDAIPSAVRREESL